MISTPGPATTGRSFTAAVFIATTLDGFIARPDGDIQWLISRGQQAGDTGYEEFVAAVDWVVMGRATYEQAVAFTPWPHTGRRVAVLSTRLAAAADPRVHVYRTISDLVDGLVSSGATRVYVDGGQVIQTFLAEGLIDEMTITTVPLLIGEGISLFGPLPHDLSLTHTATKVLGAGMVQSTYVAHPSAAPARRPPSAR